MDERYGNPYARRRIAGVAGGDAEVERDMLDSIDEVRERARHAAPNGDAVTRGA